MHIPDAYLSPSTQAAGFAVMVPLWIVAAKKTAKTLTTRQTPLLSIGAAFAFAVQMFNIPAIGGTTAHALGAALLAILVGPWAALLGMSMTLTIQALLFGDGGIFSLGVNCFNMAFIACFVSYGGFRLMAGRERQLSPRYLAASGMGAFAGTVTASLSAGILLGVQPLLAHDALGHALYCPFGLFVTIPAMVMTHLAVAGPAEAILTIAALAYVGKAFPALLKTNRPARIGQNLRLVRRFGWLLAMTPIGLLAAGSAFGEWDLGEIQHMVGYAPEGMTHVQTFIHPLLPDYGFAGLEGKPWEVMGYLVSAFLGCGLIVAFTWTLLGRHRKAPVLETLPRAAMGRELPGWLKGDTVARPSKHTNHRPTRDLIGGVLSRARATIEETVVTERIARSKGWVQAAPTLPKTLAFLVVLAWVSLAQNPLLPLGACLVAVLAAASSSVPVNGFVRRVVGSVAFFGLALALPVSLQAVTKGPVAISLGPISFSTTGLSLAALLLSRLGASISLALLWILTTRSHRMVRSLQAIGAPEGLVTALLLTYRYLFVLLETLSEMVTARTSRQVGSPDKEQARAYAGAGTAILFAKSLALTEELHQAMVSRGATLSKPSPPPSPGALTVGATDAV